MEAVVLDPVGVRVTGLAVADPAPGEMDELRQLLAAHGVAVLPDQDVDDADLVGFLARFGDLTFTSGETPLPGFPFLNAVTNVGRTEAPRSTFHTDTSYVRRPPSYTALRAVEIPSRGGETLFTNQYRAVEALSPKLRESLAGRTITHRASGVELGPDDESEADHPALRRHPISGRTSLYLSAPVRCVGVSGLGPAEGEALITELFALSTKPENIHRHAWSAGDVVMWDNRCVMHRADHSGVVGRRVLHRGMATEPDAGRDQGDDAEHRT